MTVFKYLPVLMRLQNGWEDIVTSTVDAQSKGNICKRDSETYLKLKLIKDITYPTIVTIFYGKQTNR